MIKCAYIYANIDTEWQDVGTFPIQDGMVIGNHYHLSIIITGKVSGPNSD